RRGAARIVLFVLCVQIVAFILNEHHVASFWELQLVLMFIAGLLFFLGFTWTLYIGLEPFVRRRWPQVLVSWSPSSHIQSRSTHPPGIPVLVSLLSRLSPLSHFMVSVYPWEAANFSNRPAPKAEVLVIYP